MEKAFTRHFRSYRILLNPGDKVSIDMELGAEELEEGTLDDQQLYFRVLNLSSTGMAFESNGEIKKKDNLNLKLNYSGRSFHFSGNIVRSKRSRDGRHAIEYGISFENFTQEEAAIFIEYFLSRFKIKRIKQDLLHLLESQKDAKLPQQDGIPALMPLLLSNLRFIDDDKDTMKEILEMVGMSIKSDFFDLVIYESQEEKILFRKGERHSIDIKVKNELKNQMLLRGDRLGNYQFEGQILTIGLKDSMNRLRGHLTWFRENHDFPFTKYEMRLGKFFANILSLLIRRLRPQSMALSHYKDSVERKREFVLIGESHSIQKMRNLIRVSKEESQKTHFFIGEAGVGKTLLAKIIHHENPNGHEAIGVYDCHELRSLKNWDEFLYGSDKKVGLVERFSGGSLLFRRIESLSFEAQEKLFHFISGREEIRFFLTARVNEVDVKKAVHPQLQMLVGNQYFKIDPLRDRPEDIVPLVNYYIAKECEERGLLIKSFSEALISRLTQENWSFSNVRQLVKAVHRLVQLSGNWHVIEDLPSAEFDVIQSEEKQYQVYEQLINQYLPLISEDKDKFLRELENSLLKKKSRPAA